jgi:sec-independent protein translocase protein TatC
MNFAMAEFIAFGVPFEVPILGVVLVRIGTLTAKKLREISPSAIIGAFLIFALATFLSVFATDSRGSAAPAVPSWDHRGAAD